MGKFTLETKLRTVLHTPEFADFQEYILPDLGLFTKWLAGQKIYQLEKLWPSKPIVDGFNYLYDVVLHFPHMFHRVATAESVKHDATLKARVLFHFPANKRAPVIFLCAGGGYHGVCSFVEAFPVAKRINELGFHAIVVNYRTGKQARFPNPVDDLAACISYVLEHADTMNVDMTYYAVAGFSAGGHLTGCFATEILGYARYGLQRPSAIILAYPVITMGEKTHIGSRNNILGKKRAKDEMLQNKYSVENNITAAFPPCFVWQCDEDSSVPIDNSKLLVEQLKKYNIPHIYQTYPGTTHGLGIADGTVAEGWLEKAIDFWEIQLKKGCEVTE